MFGESKKIGRPGAGNRPLSGLLLRAKFRGTDTSNSQSHAILTTFGVTSALINTDMNEVFSVKASSRFYNVTTEWSTGQWVMDLEVRNKNGVVGIFPNYALGESPNCDPANKVFNDKSWNQIVTHDGSAGSSFSVEMRASEDSSPTIFFTCEGDFFETTALIHFPNLSNIGQIRHVNEGVSQLQSLTVL